MLKRMGKNLELLYCKKPTECDVKVYGATEGREKMNHCFQIKEYNLSIRAVDCTQKSRRC